MPRFSVSFVVARQLSWTKKLKRSSGRGTLGSAIDCVNWVGYVVRSAGSKGRSVANVNVPSRCLGKKVGARMMLTSTPALRSLGGHEYEKVLITCHRFSSRPCGML